MTEEFRFTPTPAPPPLTRGWGRGDDAFQQFCERGGGGGGLKNFLGGGLDGKGGLTFGGGFRVCRDSNYKFYITTVV